MTKKKAKKKARKKRTRKARVMTEIQYQEPAIRQQGRVELEYREGFGYCWPKGAERPGKWHVRVPIPCPDCDRVYLEHATQAVTCRGHSKGIAYLTCRGCRHQFKLPLVQM